MLSWMFKTKVNVQQFTGVWLPIEEHDQAALLKDNCVLGVDSLIGKSAFSLRDKFRIKLQVADLLEFEKFLPNGDYFRPLHDAVQFYVGDVFIYDVEIGMREVDTKPLRLGSFGRLGWTTWLKIAEPDQKVRWDCRFHPVAIFSHSQQYATKDKKPWPTSASKP
jgi:type VI secretion system protein ImpH